MSGVRGPWSWGPNWEEGHRRASGKGAHSPRAEVKSPELCQLGTNQVCSLLAPGNPPPVTTPPKFQSCATNQAELEEKPVVPGALKALQAILWEFEVFSVWAARPEGK